jgi:divalent metal cation (Fe/Co/Zn/Cd) transporter
MAVEAAVGVSAAVIAGSVALLGFGLDSVIELASAGTILWRFTSTRAHSEHAERRAQQLIAGCFLALAVYLAFDATTTLADSSRPEVSWPGVAVSAAAIVLMPLLARAKQQVATQLDSGATAGDAEQSRLCALIAAGALLSVLANAAIGWWWVDPTVGLAIAAIAIREARDAWAGETCADCAPIDFDNCCANSEHRLT